MAAASPPPPAYSASSAPPPAASGIEMGAPQNPTQCVHLQRGQATGVNLGEMLVRADFEKLRRGGALQPAAPP